MTITERRSMERFSFRLPAHVSFVDENGLSIQQELTIINICAGGALLNTDRPLPIGAEVHVSLLLPLGNLRTDKNSQSRIMVKGDVIRTGDQGMALSFDKQYRISPVR